MRQAFDLAIVLAPNEPIGFCCLKTSSENSACGQLSWHISKEYWGQGFATEAAGQLLEFGFLALGFNLLSATAFADNVASIRVMDKIGMNAANNGSVASWWRGLIMGETRPIVRYEMQKEQWLAARLSQAHSQPFSFSQAA
jgi:RimJ/RimL family protein N-acetyltransferase